MLCKNCGKRIGKSAAFCRWCGSKIEKPETESAVKTPFLSKTFFAKLFGAFKQKKVLVLSVTLTIVVVIACLFVWGFFASRVNIADYIEINEAVGLSGYASLDYDFDYVALARDLDLDDMRDIKELKELEEDGVFNWGMKTSELRSIERDYDLDLDDFIELYRSVKIKIDNDGRLKNGDKARLEIEVYNNDELDKRLVGGELYFKVEDLDDATNLDLFGNTEIKFSGANGQGSITFLKDDSEAWRNSVSFTYNNVGRLSNGDTVVITASVSNYEYNKEELEKEGTRLPKTSRKTVTVEGLSTYIEFEDINEKVIDKVFDYIKATCLGQGHTNPTISGIYWVKSRENTGYYMGRNAIIINMAATQYADGYSYPVNKVCYVTDICKDENGNVVFSTTPNVLFYAAGMDEIEIVANLSGQFKGYELVTVN